MKLQIEAPLAVFYSKSQKLSPDHLFTQAIIPLIQYVTGQFL